MIRRASVQDVPAICALIRAYASRELMLPRSLASLYEHVRDFLVYEQDDQVAACAALHVIWEDLGEVRSVAVGDGHQGKGIGRQLVDRCLGEAVELGLKRVFTLTYQVDFFRKMGFVEIDKSELPHKIWNDCVHCPKFPDCDEVAMTRRLPDPASSPTAP